MRGRWAFVVGVAGGVGGCGVTHPPVAVLGATADLVGVWEGTYESRDTGRWGDLYLAVSAEGDSAVGEVVMVPRGEDVAVQWEEGAWRWRGVRRDEVLTIRFVRAGGGLLGDPVEVTGELDPYRDPDCGCVLRTTFRGEVEGDVVTGTFATEAEDPFHDAEGTWSARRRPAR